MQTHIRCICLTFSTVYFQMCPQSVWSRGCKVTLVHLFGFSPLCVFKCVLKLPAWEDAKSHWLHLNDFSLVCVFKCVLKALASEHAKSHWLHFFELTRLFHDVIAAFKFWSLFLESICPCDKWPDTFSHWQKYCSFDWEGKIESESHPHAFDDDNLTVFTYWQ